MFVNAIVVGLLFGNFTLSVFILLRVVGTQWMVTHLEERMILHADQLRERQLKSEVQLTHIRVACEKTDRHGGVSEKLIGTGGVSPARACEKTDRHGGVSPHVAWCTCGCAVAEHQLEPGRGWWCQSCGTCEGLVLARAKN
ncbi:hypothetical protein SEA_LITTLELAF_104 [Mycobacterium phage LittleLaf]|uniref:Uncharacterized protein n=2 Tax=Marvinvirus marvin TaxID=1982092 RepID=A0A385UEJ0_9CAUD|nr:hypothetical protein SEA_LITTLELAF_104 [Mycobacterium phage LittleLaf]QFP97656.1 hypothetical protein SEA_CORAZON_101 [Mycobacterium phage Corazon]URP22599.1 hypothetical protein SEA_HUPHLEPUFF_108 [Mycobacterium phage Huphlepuff]WAA20211.1 membrane protein [Mycobacterium phage Clarkson]